MKTKQIQWNDFLVKMALWLVIEVVLNTAGLDDLANYSEFVFERDTIAYFDCSNIWFDRPQQPNQSKESFSVMA